MASLPEPVKCDLHLEEEEEFLGPFPLISHRTTWGQSESQCHGFTYPTWKLSLALPRSHFYIIQLGKYSAIISSRVFSSYSQR